MRENVGRDIWMGIGKERGQAGKRERDGRGVGR